MSPPGARPRRSASSRRRSRGSPATAASTCPTPGRGSARPIAGFAGRPYAEVAVEVIRPFVGDAIPEPDLARMAREAYGSFRHPAVAPLVQFGANDFVLELFHGPTLAFKDLAMQLLGRLMDHVLAARGERTTIVVATSGDTGGAAVEAFPRPRPRRPVRAVSARPHLRRAAADDDDGRRRQRPCARDRGHVRRLPGDREGHVQPPRLSRPGAALRRQFHQLGAHRRAGGLLLHRRGCARRAASQGRLHGADRQFRRRLCRLRRALDGPAGRPPGDRHQRQRHSRAHDRDRRL